MEKTVLITGGSGFIGRHTLAFLQSRGYEIFATTSKNKEISAHGVHWIPIDLFHREEVKELIASIRPTHLLHFAWFTVPGKLWQAEENRDWLKMSKELLEEFASQGGKRAVLAGTCAEYDWSAFEFNEEKTPCKPHTLYGMCKLSLFLFLQELAKLKGFSHAWGRIFYLYGPHEHPQRFIPNMIQRLLRKQEIPCSHGNQIKDFLYVKDVADAFAVLLDAEIEGVINIGSGNGLTLKEVAHRLTSLLGGEELVRFGAIPASNEPASLIADTTKLHQQLKWTPSYTLERGLEETIAWWGEQ